MKRKKTIGVAIISASFLLLAACGSNDAKKTEGDQTPAVTTQPSSDQAEVHGTEVKPGEVSLTTPLNTAWVDAGKATYELKCQGCHKLNDQRVVGPGWSGVTKRREPHWIMNMITNVEMMLETDPEAQKLLEQCLVRMPNQNLTKDQSREVLEFMRQNDGVK